MVKEGVFPAHKPKRTENEVKALLQGERSAIVRELISALGGDMPTNGENPESSNGERTIKTASTTRNTDGKSEDQGNGAYIRSMTQEEFEKAATEMSPKEVLIARAARYLSARAPEPGE